jgi:uncharacterized membrane protein
VKLRAAILALSALGIALAAYLTYVHYADLKPFCVSGSGGCERVQSSGPSKLAGVPVALLGLIGYTTIFVTSLATTEAARTVAALTALTGFGFSVYLTYEELFVIDAVCQWCVASAIFMTALAGLTTARLLADDVPTASQPALRGSSVL